MIFRNYPVLRLLLPYVAGIVVAYTTNLNFNYYWLTPVAGICLLLSYLTYKFQKYGQEWISGILMQFGFIFFGITLTSTAYHHQNEDYNLLNDNKLWIAKVEEQPVAKAKSVKVVASICQPNNYTALKQKAVLYLAPDSCRNVQQGQIILFSTYLSEIAGPENPYAFDYKQFMKRKGIGYTAYVPKMSWKIIGQEQGHYVMTSAGKIQHYFSGIFSDVGMSGDEYSIITAILLGNDETMNPSLKSSYAAAGVSHILCVSGMHVGIIFMILDFLLKPLGFNDKTRLLKTIILMLFIWAYACITGLSPSVTRAATMFTFVSVGGLLRRNTNIFHSLYASLFILLLIKPLLLFELGFQLSYLAVFGIVLFQKMIVSLWTPKNKILSYFWNLISVSMAAQISTFPLSVFYFGQFPNYFLLANMSVIALSFIVVVSGVVLLSVSFIPFVSTAVSWVLTKEIQLMNIIITGIEGLPGAVTENISISFEQMILFYALISFIYLMIIKKKKTFYWCSLSILLFIIILFDIDKYRTQNIDNHIVFKINKTQAVEFSHHGSGVIFSDSLRNKESSDYGFSIKNYERHERIVSKIVNLDTMDYENDYLLKHHNFIITNQKIYYLKQKKDKSWDKNRYLSVDSVLIL